MCDLEGKVINWQATVEEQRRNLKRERKKLKKLSRGELLDTIQMLYTHLEIAKERERGYLAQLGRDG